MAGCGCPPREFEPQPPVSDLLRCSRHVPKQVPRALNPAQECNEKARKQYGNLFLAAGCGCPQRNFELQPAVSELLRCTKHIPKQFPRASKAASKMYEHILEQRGIVLPTLGVPAAAGCGCPRRNFAPQPPVLRPAAVHKTHPKTASTGFEFSSNMYEKSEEAVWTLVFDA